MADHGPPHPEIGWFIIGSDFKIMFDVQDPAGADRDYTGATLSANVVPNALEDDAFTLTPTLDTDPTAGPQVILSFADDQTDMTITPQRVDVYVTITGGTGDLAGGLKDIVSGWFTLMPNTTSK